MKKGSKMKKLHLLLFSTLFAFSSSLADTDKLTASEAKAIAKEAYIYGLPMVLNYKTMYSYVIDKKSPEYKGDFNQLGCTARVFTPEDKAIVTPNSDTPYCMIWADLRAEPIVLTVPEIDKKRFYEIQLIDLFTHNFAYVSTVAKGNVPGRYLITGPDWKGETPKGITEVIPSETQLVFSVVRTQLFNPDDLENVEAIQKAYRFEPLSDYLGTKAPEVPPALDFPKWKEGDQFTVAAFNYMDLMLDFVKVPKEEQALMKEFAKIGLGTKEHFDIKTFSPEIQRALAEGVKEGFSEIEAFIKKETSDPLISAKVFGTRDFLNESAKKNYDFDTLFIMRASAAHLGLYGNSGAEAVYPMYMVDAEGEKLDASKNNYTLTFKKGLFPPVKAFWSLTMYDAKTQLLIDNPLKRYLLNSPMMESFNLGKDGSLTFYIQKESPGKEKEANWLPAPAGPFYMVLRLYGPKDSALNGEWVNPPLVKVSK